MNRSFPHIAAAQFVVAWAVLAAGGMVASGPSAFASGPARVGSLSGVVRDAEGTPQVGIAVELLRANATVVARAFTNSVGNYSFASILPGQYALKATGGDFIPTLKQNLRVSARTIVDLTLSNVYDLMDLAPRMERTRAHPVDDWAWTLRTAQNRPLLRWLDDGSPILVWDGSAETAQPEGRRGAENNRKARLCASAGDGRFGESGQQISAAMLQNGGARRRVAMSADVAPDASGTMDAMLGFRQEMAGSALGSRSMQTLVAVMADPEVALGSQQGLEAASWRTWESLQMLDSLEAEAGSEQVMARSGDGSQVMAALPFASLTIHRGQTALEYRVATARSADPEAGDAMPVAWLPVLAERNGELVLEHGLHQELGWSATAGPAEMHLVIYGDSIENPMIEGSGRLNGNDSAWLLVDGASGLLRTAGPNYSSAGMLASVESKLPGHNRVKLSYASGDALVMQASAHPEDMASILAGVHARRAQMYSLVLSGTAESTGTRWRASYRWQPESTVTEVAPFAVDACEPYLNIYISQPIRVNRQGPGGLEAQIDLRNLLAEGYQPFLTSDGSHLYFAQAQRSVRGGLAFNF